MGSLPIITMNATSKINYEISKEVCDALFVKYGESFEAVKIGDRLRTSSAKLYLHPKGKDDEIFIATINRNIHTVRDNYIEQKVFKKIKKIVIDEFKKESLDANVRCMITSYDWVEIAIGDYKPDELIKKYENDHYTLYTIIKNKNIAADKIQRALINVNKKIGVKILGIAYILNLNNYKECSERMNISPEMGTTTIEKYIPTASFDFMIENGECSLIISKLASKIEGIK